ncbi:MAG: LPS export ABC transporter periplasmic protein LptC [Candidatus Tectimicrobiota bacterium]
MLLVVFCISLVVIVTTLVVRSHIATPSPPGKVTHALSQADLAMQSIHLVENRGGRTEWELHAEASETFRDKKLTVLKDIRATFYPAEHPAVHVSAKAGRLRMDTRDMVIRGDVIIQSEAGYTLKTEKLRYDARTQQVRTDLPVELVQEGLVVQGVGLSANLDGKTLTVQRDVKATFR